MTVNSFAARSTQYIMTKNMWYSEASNIDSLIGVYKEREDKSILKKFRKARPRDNLSRVPPESRIIKLFDLQTPEFGAQINEFLQFENAEMTMFFLESELVLLQNQTWFCDGTFTICKDINEQQIYIISVLFQNDEKTRVFSYPVVFVFLQGKSFSTFNKMFKVLNEKFNCAFGEELRPKNVNSDCEAGLIKSAKYIYKNIQVNLCQVHVRRSWERKLIEKIGKAKFNKSKIILSKTLTLLNGAFYVPIQFLTNIIAHLRNAITPILPFEIQNSFENFIKYLEAEYFFHNAIFKNTDWNYYGKDLSETSTNSVEAINKKLKRACYYYFKTGLSQSTDIPTRT